MYRVTFVGTLKLSLLFFSTNFCKLKSASGPRTGLNPFLVVKKLRNTVMLYILRTVSWASCLSSLLYWLQIWWLSHDSGPYYISVCGLIIIQWPFQNYLERHSRFYLYSHIFEYKLLFRICLPCQADNTLFKLYFGKRKAMENIATVMISQDFSSL